MEYQKQLRETENQIHKSVHDNLLVLSGFYPTTPEFDAIFRKDMFVKNNKAAFFEVIHYLLNILDPDLAKKHLTSWPPYDTKTEAKLRIELIAYINILNSMFATADIPVCQASSLVSPGGIRIAKLILKISQLVLYEHLKRSGQENLLQPIKSWKNQSNIQKIKLEKETKLIEFETRQMLEKFHNYFTIEKDRANKIQQRLEELNKDIQVARTKLEEAQKEFDAKYPSYPSVSVLEEGLKNLKQEIGQVMELNKLFSHSDQLLKYLNGSTMTLEHNAESFTVPSDVAHIISDRMKLDLCQFFQALIVLLEKKATFQLQSPSTNFIQSTKEKIESFTRRYQDTLMHLDTEQDHVNRILDDLRSFFNALVLR